MLGHACKIALDAPIDLYHDRSYTSLIVCVTSDASMAHTAVPGRDMGEAPFG